MVDTWFATRADGGHATPFGVGVLILILIPQWRGGAPLGANAMKTLRVLPGSGLTAL
jgi:hypothetical protein